MSKLRPQDIIEQFEIPEEYHHAVWEAFSAGADYGFFKALGKDIYAEQVSNLTKGTSEHGASSELAKESKPNTKASNE